MKGDNFIDYVKLFLRSGKGGNGAVHFRREKYVPKGGPDGGDGGRGGHIILQGDKKHWTLLSLKYRKHIHAGDGIPGSSANRSGARGKDVVVEVPPGTVIRDAESEAVVGEITRHGETLTLLEGGRGGKGNTRFKSATNQAPRKAQAGGPEKEGWYVLELKLLADVGLVGFPNAGKSTLLAVLSAAKPKVAGYPFTTLTPNLGIVKYRDHQSFVMADIPGIIEGAHKGKGLGHRFLKHIERNALLLLMVPVDSADIVSEYQTLVDELNQYNPRLLTEKKHLLVLTKADLTDQELRHEIQATLPEDVPCCFISAVAEENLARLKDMIWERLKPRREEMGA